MGLEVAIELKIATGGCAPRDYITETGENRLLESLYRLREVTTAELNEYNQTTGRYDRYTARTYINARDSDATVYFSTDRNSPGSKTTKNGCEMYGKPFVMNPNIDTLVDFIREHDVHVLNVAGNRASKLAKRDAVNFRTILKEAIKIVNEIN